MMRAAAALVAAALTCAAPLAAPAPPSVTALLDLYLQGKPDDAVRQAAALDDVGAFRLQFIRDTPAWIGTAPEHARRQAAAAGFLLEVTHARIEEDWGRLTDIVEWMCTVLRAGPPTPFERAWHVASVSLAGRARARVWLLGEYAVLPHQTPRRRPPVNPNSNAPVSPQHLIHALERFPDDPELRLARVVAWTWGRDQEPMRNVSDEGPRQFVQLLRAPQSEVHLALGPFFDDPVVGAEALIRSGRAHAADENHDGALRAYRAAQAKATDPAHRYLAFFLAGRALEALNRLDEASQQYAKALEVVPSAESATIALSNLEFPGEGRDAAAARLAARFGNAGGRDDPGRLVGYGSFMRWPELRDAMRREAAR
jgi:hypothetical protein